MIYGHLYDSVQSAVSTAIKQRRDMVRLPPGVYNGDISISSTNGFVSCDLIGDGPGMKGKPRTVIIGDLYLSALRSVIVSGVQLIGNIYIDPAGANLASSCILFEDFEHFPTGEAGIVIGEHLLNDDRIVLRDYRAEGNLSQSMMAITHSQSRSVWIDGRSGADGFGVVFNGKDFGRGQGCGIHTAGFQVGRCGQLMKMDSCWGGAMDFFGLELESTGSLGEWGTSKRASRQSCNFHGGRLQLTKEGVPPGVATDMPLMSSYSMVNFFGTALSTAPGDRFDGAHAFYTFDGMGVPLDLQFNGPHDIRTNCYRV